MPRIVRAGLIQASVGTEAPQELDHLKKYMIDKHVSMIEQAAGEGVEVLCLQELFYGPYFCAEQDVRWYSMVERVPDGPTVTLMQELAKKHNMVMVVPVYEEAMAGVYYNTAAVLDHDGTMLCFFASSCINVTVGPSGTRSTIEYQRASCSAQK